MSRTAMYTPKLKKYIIAKKANHHLSSSSVVMVLLVQGLASMPTADN